MTRRARGPGTAFFAPRARPGGFQQPLAGQPAHLSQFLLEKTDQFAAFASSSAIMDATSAARRVQQLTRHVAATTVAPVVGTSAPLSLDLSGQVALVTGGVRGIGRAISERLALNGASLVICDIDEAEVAAAAAELASSHQTEVLGLRCNVTSTDDVVGMIETIDARFGRLDIVCNNAGINVGATPEKGRLPVDQFRRSDWDNIIAVDLTGSFDVAQRSIPLLRKAGGGRIVNIASVAAVHPLRLQVGFGAAKAGVVNMTQCMALVSTTACTRLCMRAYVHGQTKL